MPLVRLELPAQLTDAQVAHVSDTVHRAMVDTFNVPADDRFQVVTRHPEGGVVCAPEYLGIRHAGPLALVQITCNEGRTVEMKKALFAALANGIAEGGAIAKADVIVSLVEVKKENWSFGDGIAQYAS